MPITYSNAFKEILDALKEILANEFKLPVHFDRNYKARSNQYFNLIPNSADVASRFSGGSTREYSVQIKYYLAKGNYGKHTHVDYLTDVGERISRLFNDKRNATSTNDLFQGVLAQFSESQGTFASQIAYTFHDGRIEGIEYRPSLSESEEQENLNVVEFEFLAIVTEVFV